MAIAPRLTLDRAAARLHPQDYKVQLETGRHHISSCGKERSPIPMILLLCASALIMSLQARPATGPAEDEAAIRHLNEQVLKAYNTGDLATVERILDPGFTLATDSGQTTKAQQMERARQRENLPSTVQLTIENAQIRFFGDTALLTEVEKWGDPADTAGFQTTSIWVKRGPDWKLVHLHYSQLAAKPK